MLYKLQDRKQRLPHMQWTVSRLTKEMLRPSYLMFLNRYQNKTNMKNIISVGLDSLQRVGSTHSYISMHYKLRPPLLFKLECVQSRNISLLKVPFGVSCRVMRVISIIRKCLVNNWVSGNTSDIFFVTSRDNRA